MNERFYKNNDNDLNSLENEFESWRFSHFNQGKDSNNISVFCCQVDSQNDLKKEWQQINSYIATTFVFKNKSPFERWNTYLLFVCSEAIPPALQYDIENNKFAMRKMLESETGKTLSDTELAAILNQKILASKIDFKSEPSRTDAPLVFSAVTTRLLAAGLNTDNVKDFSAGRKTWLDAELEGTTDYEN